MKRLARLAAGGVVAAGSLLATPVPAVRAQAPMQSAGWAMPGLSGSWAQLIVNTSLSDVPVIGRVRSETRTWLRLDIEQQGDSARVTSRVCRIEITGSRAVRTEIPRAFVAALPVREHQLRIAASAGLPGLFGWEQTEVLGARLRDPLRDPLPTRPDDQRVVDQDGDGHPGMTVKVRGMVDGDIYLVQRGWSALATRVVTDDEISGTVAWRTEQSILDATSRLLKGGPPTAPDPSPARNWFRSLRIDPGAGCDEIARLPVAWFSGD